MKPTQPSAVKDTEKATPQDGKITLLPSATDAMGFRKGTVAKPPVLAKLRKSKLLSPRHKIIATAFVFMVAIPTISSGLYQYIIANNQYDSSSSFSIRSIESNQATDLLGMFSGVSGSSTASDSFVVLDYITSPSMVEAIDEKFGLSKIYGRRGADFYYALANDMPIEDKVEYWKGMVDVNYDHTSGIINLRVKAFDAVTAQAITAFVIEKSEKLINELSQKSRDEVLRASREEVKLAEVRLVELRRALQNYRGTTQEADPVESAKLASQIIATLDGQLVQLNTDLSTALSQMDSDTPRIRVLKSRIASLEKQIAVERQRIGSGDAKTNQTQEASNVSGRIFQYETLETEREFAERAYTSALASLERARINADGQQRYMATFIKPTLSQLAQYPTRLLNVLLVFLGSVFAWSVIVMGYYNIRDRN